MTGPEFRTCALAIPLINKFVRTSEKEIGAVCPGRPSRTSAGIPRLCGRRTRDVLRMRVSSQPRPCMTWNSFRLFQRFDLCEMQPLCLRSVKRTRRGIRRCRGPPETGSTARLLGQIQLLIEYLMMKFEYLLFADVEQGTPRVLTNQAYSWTVKFTVFCAASW